MKIPFLACMSLFSVVACTAQQSSTWLGADPNAGPVQVGGSAANTTTAFDGTYRGISNSSASAASHLTATGTGAKTVDITTTPCHQFDELPTLTVKNGLAQFQALGATFAGYVPPEGQLTMRSGYGVTVTGRRNPGMSTKISTASSIIRPMCCTQRYRVSIAPITSPGKG